MDAKQLQKCIKLVIQAGAAKPSPPVGPALGQAGLNIMSFCKEFNAKTANYKEGVPLRVFVRVYNDKSYDWLLKTPPASWLIKKAAGLERAADRPGHEIIGTISLKHIYEIAMIKRRDTPNIPLEAICKNLMSSCKSMGIKVVARPGEI
jgi:large subunit ribosomal protein L11